MAAGWTLNFEGGGIAELELGNARFFLQDYYNKTWANNFMLAVEVEDAQAWYEHMATVVANPRYKTARAKAPEEQEYGALVTFVWDPSGVLIHFIQRKF